MMIRSATTIPARNHFVADDLSLTVRSTIVVPPPSLNGHGCVEISDRGTGGLQGRLVGGVGGSKSGGCPIDRSVLAPIAAVVEL